MKRSLLFPLIAVILLVTVVFLLLASRISPPQQIVLRGSLFVSDAGRSHGGFEYNAEWNATLTVEGATGTLKVVLRVGLGDALKRHDYQATDFVEDLGKISMRIEGRPVVLVWVEKDVVWNGTYDNHYIASWGSDAPPEEVRGTISPTIFPGLANFWYVELRLR